VNSGRVAYRIEGQCWRPLAHLSLGPTQFRWPQRGSGRLTSAEGCPKHLTKAVLTRRRNGRRTARLRRERGAPVEQSRRCWSARRSPRLGGWRRSKLSFSWSTPTAVAAALASGFVWTPRETSFSLIAATQYVASKLSLAPRSLCSFDPLRASAPGRRHDCRMRSKPTFVDLSPVSQSGELSTSGRRRAENLPPVSKAVRSRERPTIGALRTSCGSQRSVDGSVGAAARTRSASSAIRIAWVDDRTPNASINCAR